MPYAHELSCLSSMACYLHKALDLTFSTNTVDIVLKEEKLTNELSI